MRAHPILAVLVSVLPLSALADSTNAPVKFGGYVEPFDPQAVRWVAQETRDAMAVVHTNFTSGTITDYVIAASPYGYWGFRQGAKEGTGAVSIADLARQALEQCEFFNLAPCYILSVNGNTPVEANGDVIAQEHMLDPQPDFFDYTRVPFVPENERRMLRDYVYVAGNKALALSDGGMWAYRAAETIPQAITDALAGCKEANGGTDCSLYAVNRVVVMDFSR